MKHHRPVVCILDDDKDRCLRQEQALDAAIRARNLPVSGISNYGKNHLARTGLETFPAIEFEGLYFTPRAPDGELGFEQLCDFLDMLVRKGLVCPPSAQEIDPTPPKHA